MPTNPNERLRLWTDASHKLAGWAGDLALDGDIQDLGWIEATLLSIEGRLPVIIAKQQAPTPTFDAEDMLLNQAMALSRLWLFGLYECIRTYRRAVKGNARAWKPFSDLDATLNFVRAPLAKHAVAGRSTSHAPSRIVRPLSGHVGWIILDPQTDKPRQVFRIDLADKFLAAAVTLIGAGEAEAQERAMQQRTLQ